MTAANEKPLPCPFCGTADPYTDNEGYVNCQNMDGCGAVVNSQTFWDRRAQPAEAMDELLLALSVLADEYEALWSVCRSPVDQAADKAQGMDALDAARELLARARGGK